MFEKLRDKPLASSQERFETLIGRTTQIYGSQLRNSSGANQ